MPLLTSRHCLDLVPTLPSALCLKSSGRLNVGVVDVELWVKPPGRLVASLPEWPHMHSLGRWASYGYPVFTCSLEPFIFPLLINANCSGSALVLK